MAEKRFLQVAEIAEILGVGVPLVRGLIRSGELPHLKVGGRDIILVEESDLEAYIRQQKQAAAEAVRQRLSESGLSESAPHDDRG